MRFVAVDSETGLIEPGLLTPPLVCVSVAERVSGTIGAQLFDHLEGLDYVEALLRDPDVTIVFHNGPYDLAVFACERPWLMPLIFAALAGARIADTQTREQLLMIARGDMRFQNVESDDEGDDDDDGEGESSGWSRLKKKYTLDALSQHYRKKALNKEGGERTSFGPLRGVPIYLWPEQHRMYACDDAVATLEVFEPQATPVGAYTSPDERLQVGAAFALHLCAVHGVRTDADALDELETKLIELRTKLGARLLESGLVRWKKEKGVVKLARTMKAIRDLVDRSFSARGIPTPMSDPSPKFPNGQISTAKDTLEAAAEFPYPKGVKADDHARYLAGLPIKADGAEVISDDASYRAIVAGSPAAGLEPLVNFANCQKILGTYVAPMKLGVTLPMNSRPNVLVETGRTSWGAMTLDIGGKKVKIGANLQNFPRMPGVRECIVPRDGFLLCSVDYDSIELRTLAQTLLRIVGRSTLAQRYRDDPDYDPHTSFAARMMGITYTEGMRLKSIGDKELKRMRQLAKAPNFGYPGGMGPDKLVVYAWKNYGIRITRDEAVALRAVWFAENPEMRPYFEHVTGRVDMGGTFRQIGTGRLRGHCGFCDGANGYFQGLAADGGKAALFAVSRECYAVPEAVLFGSRPVAFIHDEILAEVPERTAHECAQRIIVLMEREMSRLVPDVPVRASPALCRSWLKAAEAKYVDGRLIPWED